MSSAAAPPQPCAVAPLQPSVAPPQPSVAPSQPSGAPPQPALIMRGYQARISETCVHSNTVVLLPTGAGKTLVAVDVIARIDKPTLFLVPTIPLVQQQAAAVRRNAPSLPVGEYHGELTVPRDFKVLVTTPAAFDARQQRGEPSFAWSEFGVVIFDEVHHVIKDHPYRKLAHKLRASESAPRIIGLTASLTYAVGKAKIEKNVQKLCNELGIDKIEHASDQELRRDGYKGAKQGSVAEVRLPGCVRMDVLPETERKPHEMHCTFFRRIKSQTATSFSLRLVAHIRRLEADVSLHDPGFISPLTNASLKSWGLYAHSRTHLCELHSELEHWYEGLKILVISWEEDDDATVLFLRMMLGLRSASDPFLSLEPANFPRFENLQDVLHNEITARKDFRGIVFAQQRVMTHVIEFYLSSNDTLRPLIRSRCLYATKSPATVSLSLSPSQSKDSLARFSTGEANLLIATSVAEEGLDIPAANCVICFDAKQTAVAYVQARGRARQENSSFIALSQRADRPATLLAAQEMEQHAIASSFDPRKQKIDASHQEMASQTSRERSAASLLLGDVTPTTAIATINLYCKKTKTILQEELEAVSGGWQCGLRYESVLRMVEVESTAPTKKQAKARTACDMLIALRA